MAGDPRIRGEHEDKRYADWDRAGSSPHTRGARAHRLLKPSGVCIIPAYAGSTTSSPTRWRRPKDHPRIRGEHFPKSLDETAKSGSSPHTRGARSARASGWGSVADHPRIRGEHPTPPGPATWTPGSSPHTRGARVHVFDDGVCRGIIPAYAGSTGPAQKGALDGRDHPRIRGEHTGVTDTGAIAAGSSPHTRGAQGV